MISSERVTRLMELGVPAIDIFHGELKNLMYEAQQRNEKKLREYMNHTPATYEENQKIRGQIMWERGYQDALAQVYKLTYDLSFARGDDEDMGDSSTDDSPIESQSPGALGGQG